MLFNEEIEHILQPPEAFSGLWLHQTMHFGRASTADRNMGKLTALPTLAGFKGERLWRRERKQKRK